MYFAAPPMRQRVMLLAGDSYGDLPPRVPHRWEGEPAVFPVIWNPKLRTNLFLKSYGFPSDNIWAHFPRADSRAYLLTRAQAAVRMAGQFNAFADQRGIPAVFVPTSAANQYGGPAT